MLKVGWKNSRHQRLIEKQRKYILYMLAFKCRQVQLTTIATDGLFITLNCIYCFFDFVAICLFALCCSICWWKYMSGHPAE